MKYVVAYYVPPYVEQVMRDNYFRITGRDLSSSNFHISLIYPFTIRKPYSEEWILQRIDWLSFVSIDAWLTRAGVFLQKKKTLYIGVEPKNEIYRVHLKLLRGLRQGINIDTRPFLRGELPEFSAHISMDYDFDGDETVLSSLKLDRFEAYFNTGLPKLYKYDDSFVFQEIT